MPSEDAKPVKKEGLKKSEKKEDEEEEEKSLSSILQARKKNPTNAGTSITKPRPKDAKVKKEEPQDDEFDKPIDGKALGSSGSGSEVSKVKKEDNGDACDHNPISKNNSAAKPDKLKELNRKKKKKEEEKKKGSVAAEQNGKKKERKVYNLPGQKRDPTEERDPLRIFYETLYKQIPNSEMAQFWMMESGLLSLEEAKKVYEKKQKKSHQKLHSPAKAVIAPKKIQPVSDKKTIASSPVPCTKKKMTDSKIAPKQSKKRKVEDGNSEDDSDDDFQVTKAKKKRS